MADRENAIKRLKYLHDVEHWTPSESSDEAKARRTITKEAIELLKAQEPVPPKANQYDAYKPVKIDRYTYDCGNCGARVMYAYGLGTYSHGASESYEDWAVKQCNFCPKCGKAVKWNG